MKLRNKKTGEINKRIDVSQDGVGIWVFCSKPQFYKSLSELNADWEDYTPQEPLIKDEMIRKAVRAWAMAIRINRCRYENGAFEQDKGEYGNIISFGESVEDLEEKTYTIAELCGEEE